MTGGLTPETYAALLAELRAEVAAARPVDRDRMFSRQVIPACFRGRPWVYQPVTLAEAADLTGLAMTSLRRWSKPSDRNRPGGVGFIPLPPPLGALPAEGCARTPPNVWETGVIALWQARRPKGQGPQLSRRKAPGPYPKDMRVWSQTVPRRRFAVLAYLRAVVREDTAVSDADAVALVAASGLDTAGVNLRGLYVQARRAEARAFTERLRLEADHSGGLVTITQVAEVYGIRREAVGKAIVRGDLREAGRTPGGRILLDPERLRMEADLPGYQNSRRLRKGLSRIPVDVDNPHALPLPEA